MSTTLTLEDKNNPNFALSVTFEEEGITIALISSWGVPRGVDERTVILHRQSARSLALRILEHFPEETESRDNPEEEKRIVEQY